MRLPDQEMVDPVVLVGTDHQNRLAGERMKWISNYRFERQKPGIMAPAQRTLRAPCCRATMTVIGEDTSERLDVPGAVPGDRDQASEAHLPNLCGHVVQAPASAQLIEGGIPTEAMVGHVLVVSMAARNSPESSARNSPLYSDLVTAKSPRRSDIGEGIEVEIDDLLKCLGGGAIAQTFGQGVEPSGIVGL